MWIHTSQLHPRKRSDSLGQNNYRPAAVPPQLLQSGYKLELSVEHNVSETSRRHGTAHVLQYSLSSLLSAEHSAVDFSCVRRSGAEQIFGKWGLNPYPPAKSRRVPRTCIHVQKYNGEGLCVLMPQSWNLHRWKDLVSTTCLPSFTSSYWRNTENDRFLLGHVNAFFRLVGCHFFDNFSWTCIHVQTFWKGFPLVKTVLKWPSGFCLPPPHYFR